MTDADPLDEDELLRLYLEGGWPWWIEDESLLYFLFWSSRRRRARDTESIQGEKRSLNGAGKAAAPESAVHRWLNAPGRVLLSLLSTSHWPEV